MTAAATLAVGPMQANKAEKRKGVSGGCWGNKAWLSVRFAFIYVAGRSANGASAAGPGAVIPALTVMRLRRFAIPRLRWRFDQIDRLIVACIMQLQVIGLLCLPSSLVFAAQPLPVARQSKRKRWRRDEVCDGGQSYLAHASQRS